MRVPFVNLQAQYAAIHEELHAALDEVLEAQSFILGPVLERFENEMSAYCGCRHAIGLASGSDALLLALMALGVSPGDGVVTTCYTFFSTAGAIMRLGAVPLFVDIDPVTFTIDPRKIEDFMVTRCVLDSSSGDLRTRTGSTVRGMIPVHLFGLSVDMAPIADLARRWNLFVVEDAAQAIGATYHGKAVGTIGQVGCLSFYPAKNLGGWGDGGMALTDQDALATTIRLLRHHGTPDGYAHHAIGINSRLDALQAAILSVKMTHLSQWTQMRRERAHGYHRVFSLYDLTDRVVLPRVPEGCTHVFYQYVIRVAQRDQLRAFLAEHGIESRVYYPLPLHLQPIFRSLGYRQGDFPEAEKAARESLAMPIYPELTEDQIAYTVATIARFFSGRGKSPP